MHPVIVSLEVGLLLCATGIWMWGTVSFLTRTSTQLSTALSLLNAQIDGLQNCRQELAESRSAIETIAPHVVGIRATLESVVRVEPTAKPSVEPQIQQLADSITILREAVETMRADPRDIQAQFDGITESVDLLRSSIHARAAEPPARLTALEAPQVPTPHGSAKTLLLMNTDHSVAHEVTWHRDVPKTYAYAGRVFELLGLNQEGQWEYLPC